MLVVAGLAAWEAVIASGWATEFFFGRPSRLVAYLVENTLNGYLLIHTGVTLYEQLVGFALGTLLGTAVGLALWWSPFLSRVLEPVALVLNATPKIAMAPILVIWFGIGIMSKVAIAVSICAIVAWLSAFDGTRGTDADQMDMVKALGGRRGHVFTKIVVPTCLPWIITAMRINIGLALVGVLAGEFLSSTHGLGYLIDRTAKLYEMSHTMAVLAIVVALAAAQYYLLDWFESRLFRWSREAELEFIT